MATKKDQLRNSLSTKFGTHSQSATPPTFEPLDLDAQAAQPYAPLSVNNTEHKPRKNVKATLNKRKRGKVQTKGFKFEITPELEEKLNKRRAQLELSTGKKVSNSQIIRQALARELRDL